MVWWFQLDIFKRFIKSQTVLIFEQQNLAFQFQELHQNGNFTVVLDKVKIFLFELAICFAFEEMEIMKWESYENYYRYEQVKRNYDSQLWPIDKAGISEPDSTK